MNDVARNFAAAVTAAVIALAPSALAGPTVAASGGYSSGSLHRKTLENIAAKSAATAVGWRFGGLNLHAFFQSMSLDYASRGDTYTGAYTLLGLGATYGRPAALFGRPGRVSATLQAPLAGTYTVLTETRTTINGESYAESALTTLQGGFALQVLTGYEFQLTGKSTGGLFCGLRASYLQQNFATQSTRIRSNNSTLAPPSPGAGAVHYSAALIGLNLSVSYER